MTMGLRSITNIERKNMNMIHAEFGEGWHLEEDTEVLVTDNILAVVEYLGYDAISLSYDETNSIVANAVNVWHKYRFTPEYFILVQK